MIDSPYCPFCAFSLRLSLHCIERHLESLLDADQKESLKDVTFIVDTAYRHVKQTITPKESNADVHSFWAAVPTGTKSVRPSARPPLTLPLRGPR